MQKISNRKQREPSGCDSKRDGDGLYQKSVPGIRAGACYHETTGDKILDRTLDKIGGKGLFVKELDAALLDGRSDLSVHSLKDMPAEIPTELPLIGFSKREDPRDVLVLPDGVKELDFFQTGGMFESAPDVAVSEIVSTGNLCTDSWKCTDTSGKTGFRGVLCNDSGSSRIKTTGIGKQDYPIFFGRRNDSGCRTGRVGVTGTYR